MREKALDFWKMIAQEKTESTSRRHSTTRATQPVCSIRVPSRLSISRNANPEIISPRKFSLLDQKYRSTRPHNGQTNQPLSITMLLPLTTRSHQDSQALVSALRPRVAHLAGRRAGRERFNATKLT